MNNYKSLHLTPEEAFEIICRINQTINVGGKKVTRLEAEHLSPKFFHEKYGFTPLLNFFNSLSDYICDPSGKINKEFNKEHKHVVDWYKQTSKYIKYHFQKGVSDYKS